MRCYLIHYGPRQHRIHYGRLCTAFKNSPPSILLVGYWESMTEFKREKKRSRGLINLCPICQDMRFKQLTGKICLEGMIF